MLLIESGLVLLAVLVAFLRPTAGSRFFERAERSFSNLANRRRLAVIVSGAAALALRLALLPVLPVPEPIVHDEFGYLLAADTFAHGHITNPPHPMWVHFETFSVLQQPTYQCYGPPMQGLVLAAGTVLAGHPFWGVWFSAGLMCAAICWMLQGWFSPPWALLGALLAVLRLGTLTYWANSYWGGAMSAIGGALVLGSLPRIKNSQRLRDAIIMALGLGILANSRPYEGFVLGLPVAVAMLAWMLGKKGPNFRTSLRKIVLPLCALLALVLFAMGYYNWRVTGHPTRNPYQVEQATYAVAPYMIWQSPKAEPVYHHEIIRKMYVDAAQKFYVSRSLAGPAGKLVWLWLFFVGPVFTLPILMALFYLPYNFSLRQLGEHSRFLLIVFAIFVSGLLVEVYQTPHYQAPATCLFIALVLLCMRRLRAWQWRDKPVGLFLTRAIPTICVISFLLRVAVIPLHITIPESHASAWFQEGPPSFGRAELARQLERSPGQQLVIVRYESTHRPFEEWVYNDANIDASKVVWAHAMSPLEDQQLVDYFPGRQVLLWEPDQTPPRMSPYPPAEGPSSPGSIKPTD
jgi:hypothetical protein